MYRKRFIEDLLHYVDSHRNKLPGKDLVDDPLMQQLRDGLKQIPAGYGMGCSLRFLFVPSSGLVSQANKTILGLFSSAFIPTASDSVTHTTSDAHTLFTSTFPERSFYYTASDISATGKGPNLSLTEHLTQSGSEVITTELAKKTNYVVGVHVRFVKDDTGKIFSDGELARYTMDDLFGLMECAKALVDKRRW
eukprot:GHVQ01004787.1.p1 GENE.GHVQ01004787.1~~GHVQ01004787.1.p1  ORF type:complete len:193 (-),score=15.68 GHVQ01004787.1:918-1496(-)